VATGVGILFACLCFLVAVLAMRNASIVMYAMIAYTPIDTLLPEGLPFREVPELLRLALLTGVLLGCLQRGHSLKKLFFGDWFARFLVIWWATIVVSFVFSDNYSAWALRTLVKMTSYFALYFAIRSWMGTRKQVITVQRILSFIVLFTGLFAIVQVIYGGYTPLFGFIHNAPAYGEWDGRAPSFLNSGPNGLGGFLGVLLPLEFGMLALSKDSARSVFCWVVIGCGVAGLVLSGSRGGAISVIATAILAVVCFSRRRISRIIAVGALVVALPVLTAVASIVVPRLTRINTQESVNTRYLIWDSAWGMFLQHPVLGIGMGNFRESYDPNTLGIEAGAVDVHNLYLQLLTETGVIGFGAFAALVASLFVKSFGNMKRYRRSSIEFMASYVEMAVISSVLIHGAVDFLFIGSTEYGAALMIVLALAGAITARGWSSESLVYSSIGGFVGHALPEAGAAPS
jgi:O-antigen ligase